MKPQAFLDTASLYIKDLASQYIDIVEIKQPKTIEYALNLAKVVSKLSPLIGNMIEFTVVDTLNTYDWQQLGKWERQDPGFPDAVFSSNEIKPNPGIEIKAWFPFATEITARFKESQNIFQSNPYINVALIAWLPENVIWGKPFIIDTLIVSGESVAKARDNHYFDPPSYIVLEPEDTSKRTENLQQTNTIGYSLQEHHGDINRAKRYVAKLGKQFLQYSPDAEKQVQIKELQRKFAYREDTNYAKIDRIDHPDIEEFKSKIENTMFNGKTIKDWSKLLSGTESDDVLKEEIKNLF